MEQERSRGLLRPRPQGLLHRSLRLGAALVGATLVLAAAAPVQAQSTGARAETQNRGAQYKRTTTETVLRNFMDENGTQIATLPKGTLVREFRGSGGRPAFSEVEVAGGFPVWVYGKYLQPSDVEGVLLVTGSRVNMRPLPNSTPAALPISTRLEAGQRVRFIERANKSVALGEDWVRIQAPMHAKAWVRTDTLTAVRDERAASSDWLDLSQPLPAARPRPTATVTNPTRPAPKAADSNARQITPVAPEVLQQLVEADEAFEAASALKNPTVEAWSDVVAGYRAVLASAPQTSVTYQKAQERFDEASVQMEYVELREEYAQARNRNDAEIRRIDRMLDAQQKRKTARWGRFEERGWLEERNVGGAQRWYLVFGGETVAEVRCLNQRYDLDVFEGFEIGIVGREIAPVVRATATSLAEARVVDAQRIEVISGRGRMR